MSYVQKVLQPGETVRFSTNVHWIEYVPGAALFVLAAVIYVFTARPDATDNAIDFVWFILTGLTLLVAAAGIVLLFLAWFHRWTTEIAVTDRRIIYKYGFIRRKTVEMSLSKIESVRVDQSILGRIFGYGNIELRGTGGGDENLPPRIAEAIDFRSHVTAE